MQRFRWIFIPGFLITLLFSLAQVGAGTANAQATTHAGAEHSQHVNFFYTPRQGQTLHRAGQHATSGQPLTTCGGTSSGLLYHCGGVEKGPIVHAIFWGPTWVNSRGHLTQDGRIANQYFLDVAGTSYFNILTQYFDTIGSIRNQLTFDFTLDPSVPPTDSTCGGPTIEDSSIQNEISNQIATNGLGWQATHNTTFFVFTPSNDFVAVSGFCSEQVFCGYHSFASPIKAYALIAYPFDAGCQVPSSPSGNLFGDSLTNITSHELFEAITDPDVATGWFGPGGLGDEIGDKCNFNFSSGFTSLNNGGVFEIQTEFSNASLSCVNHFP